MTADGLKAAVIACMIVVTSAPAAERGGRGFVYVTQAGTIEVPRDFAPIEEWRTMKVPVWETNYFVFRIPASYVEQRVPGFSRELNFVDQDVIVAIEAISGERALVVSRLPRQTCRLAAHDNEPRSSPYDRCEYRRELGPDLAAKFWLNGTNGKHVETVASLIRELVGIWRSPRVTR